MKAARAPSLSLRINRYGGIILGGSREMSHSVRLTFRRCTGSLLKQGRSSNWDLPVPCKVQNTIHEFVSFLQPVNEVSNTLTRPDVIRNSRSADKLSANLTAQRHEKFLQADTLREIFDRPSFTSLNPAYMTLAICRVLIESQGGKMVSSDIEGKATTLTLTLPFPD